ncbi:hypothetical protein ACFQ1L_25305 [Phytohabitans flavus]|nr:hypothetical protein [Phytohabitans flavus]
MNTLTERRATARGLLNRYGRGFADACGFSVIANPASLFQLLILAVLTSGRGDYHKQVALAHKLREQGWDSPTRLAGAPHERRVQVIRAAGRRDAERLATTLGDLAEAVADRYRGDLRRLRRAAGYKPDQERRLLTELPNVSDRAADLFFQEVQVLWSEVFPFAERRALAAARKLGLATTTAELASITGGDESERLAWVAGALTRLDRENGTNK